MTASHLPTPLSPLIPATLPDYPRPQLERRDWTSLNGRWDFAIDPECRWSLPAQVVWNATIIVPFSPEAPASGLGDTGFYRACWYRRTFDLPHPTTAERVLLHFGAVDYAATVWLNGAMVTRHEGGYTPFLADITDFLLPGPIQTVVVRAEDDPQDLAKPRGKQDWQLEPHVIWYPRTTGIWQTVWIETVPPTRIGKLRWTSNLERWEIGIDAWLDGARREGLRLKVRLTAGDTLIADDTYAVIAGELHRRIALSDPGIDDSRNAFLWSPERPVLIQAELELWGGRGELIDQVRSYAALRTVRAEDERFFLNGRPYYLRLVLDQGYWPETGLSAPSDEALQRDIELIKAMGFNGVRKHQKVEDPRFLYFADRMGLLVWEEMPSAYRFTQTSIERLTREWMDVIDRDYSHPCIVTWVPFNESWGVPDLPSIEAQRHYVTALYRLTKTLDSTRPVIGNDGWESIATDIIGIHDYEMNPVRLAERYRSTDDLNEVLRRLRPGGRALTVGDLEHTGQPVMLTEFGGLTYTADPSRATWGYRRCDTVSDLEERYTELLKAVKCISLFGGFCYTQLTDTYQEANGLLYADRTPKFPLKAIELATSGWCTD
ncbi:MAG: glycoside hydrolase family 2 protein [Gemmatimonadaceae bacterium]